MNDVHVLDLFAAVLAGAADNRMLSVVRRVGQESLVTRILLEGLGDAVEALRLQIYGVERLF